MTRGRKAAVLVAAALLFQGPAHGHEARSHGRLPVVGAAPHFDLATHAGGRLTLAQLRGSVVAVTFVYATCRDTCPTLVAKMVGLQRRLGAAFGRGVHFVAVTVEPEIDTPPVLAAYARRFEADVAGWSFLTGTPEAVRKVVRGYGAYARRSAPGDVDHLFITTLVDKRGMVRVQYLGYRFDAEEMMADLKGLLAE